MKKGERPVGSVLVVSSYLFGLPPTAGPEKVANIIIMFNNRNNEQLIIYIGYSVDVGCLGHTKLKALCKVWRMGMSGGGILGLFQRIQLCP